MTATTTLSNKHYSESSQIPGPAVLDLPQTTAKLHNDFSIACGPGGMVSMTRALQISCNTAFAGLGLKLGAKALQDQAAKFGFGQSLRIPMPVTPSSVPADLNAPETAQSAIGQFDVRVTPLQVAMVAAANTRDIRMMSPAP